MGIYFYSGPFEWCLILGGWCGSTSYIHIYIYIYTHTMCVCLAYAHFRSSCLLVVCGWSGMIFDGEVWWYCCLGPMSHQKTKLFKCCLICSEELFGVLTVCWLSHRVFSYFYLTNNFFSSLTTWIGKTIGRRYSDWNRHVRIGTVPYEQWIYAGRLMKTYPLVN